MKTSFKLAALTLALSAAFSTQAAEISTKGGFKVKSDDGRYTFAVGGRIQMDGTAFNSDDIDLNNGTEMRRARITLKANIEEWEYKLDYDYISSESVKDAFIAYNGFKNTIIQIGNQRQAFGMEANTSSNDVSFIERSLITDPFDQGRGFGIAAKQWGDNWSLNYGVYGQDVNAANGKDEELSFNGRFAYAPIKEKDRMVSFGFSALQTELEDGGSVRLRARPESHQANTRIVDSSSIATDSYTMFGLESMMQFGSLTLLGEYIKEDVDSVDGSDPSFDGYFVSASYLLDGGMRNYTTKGGKFKGYKPGANGAWELTARISSLDLNDADANVFGGKVDSITLGANYYINSNMLAKFNVVSANGDEFAKYDSTSVGARLQVVW
ncbi:OprO/OprP family phosphate-selective porin [Pseudoalteromonas xiamenensis]|uniref:OprO/OprP family phosphate-selective porin n=1 Tax=Pseudoalteromonas xiamenensis TaxID=882626 RepID=UPI0035E963F2